ncbi:MAG: AmmeMemoRadiSam system protein A [Nanoarchaeota archaeon]
MLGKYSEEDGKKLIKLARESIEEEFTGKKPEMPGEKQFRQARGVFVTLNKNNKLRGCIGFPYPTNPVAEAVYLASREAAFSDPRFPPLKEEELKDIEIEISILTSPQECNCKEVKIGEDGLMCNYLGYQGLLLPQVATENKFDRIKFLECLCNKAGLPRDTWQNKNFKLWKFQCQIFGENSERKSL